MTKKCQDEKPLWLAEPWVVARVEDIEDIDEVQMVLSLLLDSPILLMTEKEYRNTLQRGEKQGLEAL